MTNVFPYRECQICKSTMTVRDSHITADNFIPQLRHYAENQELWTPSNESVVQGITQQYFRQFGMVESGGIVTGSDYVKRMQDMANPQFRLKTVLEANPEKWVFVVGHDRCFDEFDGHYNIGLERINTPSKAIDWSIHLNEKGWFNAGGWIEILEDLFGRDAV